METTIVYWGFIGGKHPYSLSMAISSTKGYNKSFSMAHPSVIAWVRHCTKRIKHDTCLGSNPAMARMLAGVV